MLMITVETAPAIVTLRLNGRLTGAEARELVRMWEAIASAPARKNVLLDLSEVTSVDVAGRAFLEQAHKNGNRLVSGAATKAIVDEIDALDTLVRES